MTFLLWTLLGALLSGIALCALVWFVWQVVKRVIY